MAQFFSEVKELSLRLGASTTRLTLPALVLLFLSGSRAQAGLLHVEPAFPSVDISQAEPPSAKPFDLFLGTTPDLALATNDMSIPAATLSAGMPEVDDNAELARRCPSNPESCLPFAARSWARHGTPATSCASTHSKTQVGSLTPGPILAQLIRGQFLRTIGGPEPGRHFVVRLFRPPRNVG
jgi:hypothetical protein